MNDGQGSAQTSPSHPTDKRNREIDDEGRASKAIRTRMTKERSRRAEEGVISEEPNMKILRTQGESRGEITKTILLHKLVINHENKMVDAIDSVEWEETKEELRELRTPVIHIDGGNRKRGTQACEIQALSGGYFLWKTEKSAALDLMTLEKIKRIGGSHLTIGNHRVWTNSDVIRRRIMEEKERRAWRDSRGLRSSHQNLWGQVFTLATEQQLDRRELNSEFDVIEYQPRRIL